MNHTTRRFPRSTLEAWPNRHPYSIEHYSRRAERTVNIALTVILGVAFGLSLLLWWGGM